MSTSVSLRDELAGAAGYSLQLSLSRVERNQLQQLIESQWLARLRQAVPQQVPAFAAIGLPRYHELSHLVDHSSLWPKSSRVLPADVVARMRTWPFMRQLQNELGAFAISDEDQVGHEQLYWRLVRPQQASDIGPLHADGWFWELNDWPTPPGARRVKVWIAVHTEAGQNGLRVVPGSHLRSWRYHGEHRHGLVKPRLEDEAAERQAELVPMRPGQILVFHDQLVHGGAMNVGTRCRVSLEFTMFIDP